MKQLFVTLFFCGSLATASAQTKNTIEFGVDAGFNAAYVFESQAAYHSDEVSGFNFGAWADYYFSDRWSLKVKVIYDQKGWGNGYLQQGETYVSPGSFAVFFTTYGDLNYKLNYLTVPILANWHFGRKRNWLLDFGPYVGFLLNTSVSGNTQLPDDPNVRPFFKSTDFGISLGIGVKFPISDKMNLFIEDEGQAGFINIFKGSGGAQLQAARQSLNVGLSFPMK